MGSPRMRALPWPCESHEHLHAHHCQVTRSALERLNVAAVQYEAASRYQSWYWRTSPAATPPTCESSALPGGEGNTDAFAVDATMPSRMIVPPTHRSPSPKTTGPVCAVPWKYRPK